MSYRPFSSLVRYALPPMPDSTALLDYAKKTGKTFVWNAPTDNIVGIEVEAENMARMPLFVSNCWQMIGDGSLRQGMEFRSFPLFAKFVPLALYELFAWFDGAKIKPDFNERTSVHVHVDFRQNTQLDLIKFILAYLPFERYLYQFSGPERSKSNFCVPMSDLQVATLRNVIERVTQKEIPMEEFEVHLMGLLPQKYSAVNVLPLFIMRREAGGQHTGSGSVEFRHMAGTGDVDKIASWVSILLHLKQYAVSTPLNTIREQIVSLNTTSQYQEFADAVFGPYGRVLIPASMNWKLLSQSLTLTKQALAKNVVVAGKDFLRSPLAAQLQDKYEGRNRPKPAKKVAEPLGEEIVLRPPEDVALDNVVVGDMINWNEPFQDMIPEPAPAPAVPPRVRVPRAPRQPVIQQAVAPEWNEARWVFDPVIGRMVERR